MIRLEGTLWWLQSPCILFLEGDRVSVQGALNEGQGVSLASHQLGGHELLALASLELCSKGLRLEAHVHELLSVSHWNLGAVGLHSWAAVCKTRALHLLVSELAELLGSDGTGWLRSKDAESHAQSSTKAQQ